MLNTDVKKWDGQTVLVRTADDLHSPPVGRRGTLRVVTVPDEVPGFRVEVVLDFPDMFSQPAHQRVFVLNEAEIDQLLVGDRTGVYEVTLTSPLDWQSEPPMRVSPGSLVKR
jgi:hypothetical protein